MDTTLNHQIKVGIFASVGLALFCLSIVLLGGDKFFLSVTYDLKIHMPQAQGLSKGSVVTLVGVPIGNVEGIKFLDNNPDVEVTISIQKSVQKRITEGSKATIKTQGALGDKYVYIEPGPRDGKPLEAGSELAMDKTPDFFDIVASKGAEMGEIVEVIKEVRILFQNINHDGRSAKLMSNLVDSSSEFAKTMQEARETFRLMRTDTLAPLSNVIKKIDRGQGSLGALINDPTLHNRLTNMLGDAPRNKFLKPLIRDSIQTNEEKK